MNKVLKPLLEKAEALSAADQRALAQSIEQFLAVRSAGALALDDDERSAINKALAEVEDGQIASEDEVAAILHRPWK